MANTATTNQKTSTELPTSTSEIVRVLLVGAVVGLLTVLLAELIARFFIEPVFCRSTDSFSVCANGGSVAFNSAAIIVSAIAVAFLVKFGVFRPLLVALGPVASLWGINAFVGRLPVFEYGFWVVTLFALAYILFFWLMRARNFVISLVALIVTVVLIRYILAS